VFQGGSYVPHAATQLLTDAPKVSYVTDMSNHPIEKIVWELKELSQEIVNELPEHVVERLVSVGSAFFPGHKSYAEAERIVKAHRVPVVIREDYVDDWRRETYYRLCKRNSEMKKEQQ